MINHFGKPRTGGPDRAGRRFRKMAASARHGLAAYQLPRQRLAFPPDTGSNVHCAGQPTRCNCCAMSDLARCAEGARDIRTRGLHQFPVTLDLKAGTELYCISSGITALRKFYATQLDIWAARTASDRIVGRKTRRNPGAWARQVSIRPKSVAIELAVVVVCRIFCLM